MCIGLILLIDSAIPQIISRSFLTWACLSQLLHHASRVKRIRVASSLHSTHINPTRGLPPSSTETRYARVMDYQEYPRKMVVLEPRSNTIIQQPDLREGCPIAFSSCHDWSEGSWSTPHPGGSRFEEFIIGSRILPLSETKPDHVHELKQHSVCPGKIIAGMSEMFQAGSVFVLIDGGLVHDCQEQLLS